ncbi:N-acetyltransferase [Streptomyces botrytidirepellens]|uniref:N-acetyltransferase n=1 Tax=Streptomyces botrytidirepellens TaxID=2486417 RepID=A0A3M8X8S6_9ACTN|nr:N-acetyltransferase [Streptomyces botrytidirepellens]
MPPAASLFLMDFVDVALDSVWPAELRTDRLLLRPIVPEDGSLVRELLTDERVRAYLGGPVSYERVAARQAAYPETAGAWAVVRVADGRAVGLAGIGPDPRCEGRAEVSYLLLPFAWGSGLGHHYGRRSARSSAGGQRLCPAAALWSLSLMRRTPARAACWSPSAWCLSRSTTNTVPGSACTPLVARTTPACAGSV